MAKLEFDKAGERLFETGVKNGVLFVMEDGGTYGAGVVWNGLTNVTEKPSGAEPTNLYADDIKYLSLYGAEEFEATIEAYTYPEEFEACDGSKSLSTGVAIGQQERKTFAFCYRTAVGNDIVGQDYGYKLHIIYGAKAKPSEKGYSTINNDPEAITFSWDISTTPVNVTGFKPTATVVIDSTKAPKEKLAKLEESLYGTVSDGSKLLMPDEIKTMFEAE